MAFSSRASAAVLAILGILLFSTKAIFAKLLYQQGVDTMGALMLRMGFAIPIYLIMLFSLKSTTKPNNKQDHFYLFLLGFAGYYLASFLDFKGLMYIKASLERLILFIYPTLVIILSALLLKKPITRIQKIGVAITYAGVIIVFSPELVSVSDQTGDNTLIGGSLVFLSALSYSLYLVGSQWLIPRFGVRRFTAIAMLWSGAMVLVHYLISVEEPMAIFDWNLEVYVLGALMAFFSTFLPSFLISQGIHKLGAAQFSILAALGPVSTISLAYLFLDEQLTAVQLLGSLVVIGGVLIAEYFAKKKATNAP